MCTFIFHFGGATCFWILSRFSKENLQNKEMLGNVWSSYIVCVWLPHSNNNMVTAFLILIVFYKYHVHNVNACQDKYEMVLLSVLLI